LEVYPLLKEQDLLSYIAAGFDKKIGNQECENFISVCDPNQYTGIFRAVPVLGTVDMFLEFFEAPYPAIK